MAKSLTIQPLSDKVIVRRSEAEAKTAGGIVLPDSAKEKPKRGIVEAVGPGRLLDNGERSPLQIKKGDEVLFTSYGGTDIQLNEDKLVIMDENDVLGVLTTK